jgi:hypothetical protein
MTQSDQPNFPPDYKQYVPPLWQRRWIQNAVPLATSIIIHLVVFVTAVLLVPPLVHSFRETSREQVIVPDTMLAPNGNIGGVPNSGLARDPTRQASQENDPAADTHGWANRRSESLAAALGGSQNSADELSSGINLASGHSKDNSALNPSGDAGGQAATFGPRGGGMGIGPKSKIFGEGSNVKSVIYVCDGSGSMVGGKDQTLRVELKNAVAHLAPIQAFNILIFQVNKVTGAQYYSPSGDKLIMATPSNQNNIFRFLDRQLTFSRETNPMPALEAAFREKPQLIYLLTDGDFNDPSADQVLAKINQLNRDKKVHINTVLLLGTQKEKDDYKDFEIIMNKIASDNGGVYKKYYSDSL